MRAGELARAFPASGICLGIDPTTLDLGNGSQLSSRSAFDKALQSHERFLEQVPHVYPLKPNLAYFLRHGSWGLGRLEDFCEAFGKRFPILLDAKFGEIATSLEAYLDFAFGKLQVQAVTLNPFMGEGVLRLGLKNCLAATGGCGRIFVLCATSETGDAGSQGLGALQDVGRIAKSCNELALSASELVPEGAPLPVGLVVGANREDVFSMSELRDMRLPLLCPGLGAQGASWEFARDQMRSETRSCLFPLSRYIFSGGRLSTEESLERLMGVRAKLGLSVDPAEHD